MGRRKPRVLFKNIPIDLPRECQSNIPIDLPIELRTLFYHNYGRAQNLTHGVYHYYVMNHVTKQCVAVSKPTGQISRGYSYATLVYDPTKSRFFQIVNFQGLRHVNVFSSKNGI